MNQTNIITECLYHILKMIGPAERLKLIKLLYLADKYHLARYGRTITNDEYYAMEFGPVGSIAKDVINFNEPLSVIKEEKAFIKERIGINGKGQLIAKKKTKFLPQMLSETDIDALNYIIKKFGRLKKWDLVGKTHKFPEWVKHEKALMEKTVRRAAMPLEDILNDQTAGLFDIPSAHVKESKRIMSGCYT